ncbi:MAG: DoxX family membrane protein [Caldithrix sp.]|nr:DoxX family membrane protein [Caldithrix sp.]
MLALYQSIKTNLERLTDVPPLLFRLILSYGFYEPAIKKMDNIDGIAQWFASMNYPFPTLNAYLAGITETLGFILLFLGLGTRIITLPLMFVMLVAIFTVHIGNGFAAGDNGFEIPLYYLLMLISLFITGPGRVSLDALIEKFIGAKQ